MSSPIIIEAIEEVLNAYCEKEGVVLDTIPHETAFKLALMTVEAVVADEDWKAETASYCLRKLGLGNIPKSAGASKEVTEAHLQDLIKQVAKD